MNQTSSSATGGDDDGFDPFAQGAIERVIPTSEAQREVWLADKLSAHASLAFNESVRLRMNGPLDAAALRQAMLGLLRRHACLRATVSPDGMELLVSAVEGVDIAEIDLQALPDAEQQRRVMQAATDAVSEPFDLERGPLFRVQLYQLAADAHVLLMTAHHIVCDGWSWGLITQDLGALYAEQLGHGPSPEPAHDYADYITWEAAEAASSEGAEHERFWLGRFAGGQFPVLDLPTDRARSAQRSFVSDRVDHELDAGLIASIRKLGAQHGASLFASLFSGFVATLHRVTGQDDLVIGVPSAGQSASGLQQLVGHCVNLLPLRTAVDAQVPFDGFLKQTASALLDAFEHQSLTYSVLLRKLSLPRDPSRLPLVSVMLNVDQAVDTSPQGFPGLEVMLQANPRRFENFELFVNAVPSAAGALRLECQYNTDLFDAETVARWLRCYEALLRSAAQDPRCAIGSLGWLAADDATALAALQPHPVPAPADARMHVEVERQCRATPERIALTCDGRSMTYAQLDDRSNRLAHALRARGIRRGDRVGLCLRRGPDMVVTLLAVLKAGGTYVPLDPGFPSARLAYYAEDAQLALLLTESAIDSAPSAWRVDAAQRVLRIDTDTAWLQQPGTPLVPDTDDARPEDAAYIIYTSGSTGTPKGVCVPHRSVANFLASMRAEPGLQAGDRLAAVTTLSFDIAVLELLTPLTVGAEVVIVPRDTAMDGTALAALLDGSGCTVMQGTPSLWRGLVDTDWRAPAGFKALVGGESLPRDLAETLMDRGAELWNLYGPTETTVWSTVWPVSRQQLAERGMSIGRPIDNTTVWILDAQQQPCPIGVPGEIYIGGSGVALGYHQRPELTAERFVHDALSATPGTTLYRTGDRGRWRNDGLLEHMGRLDFQVKVRGYRIELGEIESVCALWPGVSQAVVLAREDHPGDVRLVAYVVGEPGMTTLDEPALREHMRSRLPDYMVPMHFVLLASMPLLPNRKIDRKALPAPDASVLPAGAPRVAPRNALERQLLGAMEEVLKLPGLGVHDDFFELGGHSLLAARLTSRLNRELGLALPLRTLFESPTVARLAAAVEVAQQPGKARRGLALRHEPGLHEAPLTPMQERIRFMDELYPGSVVYNTPSSHRLKGPMDVPAFQRAFLALQMRQSALRTCIVRAADGNCHQRVAPGPVAQLPFFDLSGSPAPQREDLLKAETEAIIARPLNLYGTPLFHCALFRLSELEHVFVFVPHHIVWDGWSFDVLYQDMAALYGAELSGVPCARPPVPFSYGDYARWYRAWQDTEEAQAQLDHWRQRFEAIAPPRALASDGPRKGSMIGAGGSMWITIDPPLTKALRAKAQACNVTVNMLAMSVFAAMLGRLSGSSALVLGIPVRGRQMAELDDVMGFFNNMLPMPVAIDLAQPFDRAMHSIKQTLLDALSHQEVPFETLSMQAEIKAKSTASGLYQAAFSFQDVRERKLRWGELEHTRMRVFQKGVTEELGLWLAELPESLSGAVTYNVDVFSEATAQALRDWFCELLRRAADQQGMTVSQLTEPMDSAAARHLFALAETHRALQEARASTAPLPAPKVSASELAGQEAELAAVWARLLAIDLGEIRASDNFFDLGGDSILAMRAVEAAAAELGVRVNARRYIYETLAQIAATTTVDDADAEPVTAASSGGLVSRFMATLRGRKAR